jgi:tetratricopeptide (TPR) repeat protein
MMKGEYAGAIASFDRALVLQPALEEPRLNRGIALLRQEQFVKASAEFEKIFADEHTAIRADAAYHNAIALDRLGRGGDAEKWLARALTLDPALDAALLYTGLLRERRGDLQGAGRAYLDYLKAHPDSLTAMLHFGLSAHKAGRIDVARSYLEKVIKTEPESLEAAEARKFLVMWE